MTGNLGYLVAAYGVFWAGTMGLVLSLIVRQRRIEARIRHLEGSLRHPSDSPAEHPAP